MATEKHVHKSRAGSTDSRAARSECQAAPGEALATALTSDVETETGFGGAAPQALATAVSRRAKGEPLERKAAPVALPKSHDLVEDSSVWIASLQRANRRIRALTDKVQKLDTSNQGRFGEISMLQSIVARLRDEKLQLDGKIGELLRENEALRIALGQRSSQVSALVRSTNRLQNNIFWTVCHFIAGSSEFEEYANGVDYDLTRLFCMLLAAEIRETSHLSPRIQAHAAAIANIFDPFFYLTEYHDVALAGINPLLHYVTYGFQEGRQPSQLFDTVYYAEQAKLPSGDPLLHYVEKGADAGLKPHPLFDGKYYWSKNDDVSKRKLNPLFHYQTWGGRERRNPSPLFDTEYFLMMRGASTPVENPLREYLLGIAGASVDPHPLFLSSYFLEKANLQKAPEAPLAFYARRSNLHARTAPHPLFDLNYVKQQLGENYPEGMSPLEAFCRLSEERDVDPSVLFDSKLYRYQIEVERGQSLSEPPILDYLKRRHTDKSLRPNLLFCPKTYLERNRIEVSGPELTHYCLVGDRAGLFTHDMFSAGLYNEQRTDGNSEITALGHFLAAGPDAAHISHPQAGRPLSHETIEFAREVYSGNSEFNAEFYRSLHPDLSHLGDDDARKHFEGHGQKEGRSGSARDLVREQNLRISDLPLGFFADEYLDINPDLSSAGLKRSFHVLYGHYLRYGRHENRSIGKWQFYLDALDLQIPTSASPLSLNVGEEKIEVGVLIHLFYTDLWPELAAFARNFEGVSRDIFVNVVDIAWSPAFQRQLRELCPDAFVQLSNDNGRDIGGFVRLLDNVDIQKYDYFAWMHSKKSPHLAQERGDYWRRSLLNSFAGNRRTVASCIQLFKDDPSVGLIGAKEWRSTVMGGRNEDQFRSMLDHFDIEEKHRSVEYLSGTMFLMRSDVVQRLYDGLKELEWEFGGDKGLAFHVDGQIAHAVERVIGNLVRQMGYRIAWR